MHTSVERQAVVLISYYFIGLLLFLAQTPGFDLYSHGFMHYYFDEAYLGSYLVFDIKVPRYFLLSYFYGIGRVFGIPSGWVAFVVWSIPMYALYSYFRQHRRVTIGGLLAWVVVFLTATKYSSFLIGTIWLISYYLTGRKYLLLGFFFHPLLLVGLLVFLFKVVKNSHVTYLIKLFFLVLSLNYLNNILEVLVLDSNYRTVVSYENIKSVAYLSQRKSEYLFLAVFALVTFEMTQRLKVDVFFVYITPFLIMLLVYGFVFLFDKTTGLIAMFGEQYEYISITWLDFGFREYVGHDKESLRELRNAHIRR